MSRRIDRKAIRDEKRKFKKIQRIYDDIDKEEDIDYIELLSVEREKISEIREISDKLVRNIDTIVKSLDNMNEYSEDVKDILTNKRNKALVYKVNLEDNTSELFEHENKLKEGIILASGDDPDEEKLIDTIQVTFDTDETLRSTLNLHRDIGIFLMGDIDMEGN